MASWVACDIRTASLDPKKRSAVLCFEAPDSWPDARERAVRQLGVSREHRDNVLVLAIADGESTEAAVERALRGATARRLEAADRVQGVKLVGAKRGNEWDAT